MHSYCQYSYGFAVELRTQRTLNIYRLYSYGFAVELRTQRTLNIHRLYSYGLYRSAYIFMAYVVMASQLRWTQRTCDNNEMGMEMLG